MRGHGVAATLLLVLAAAPLDAQARLEGRVTTAQDGRAIAAAEVRIEGADTLRLRTAADGTWRVQVLAPGRYRVRVRAIGHVADTKEFVFVDGAHDRWDVALVEAALALDQVVVTATRRPQRLGDAPITVEVVGRADLERSGASDLSTVLTEHTGIDLQGGHPAGTGVMLQGLSSERVLVLLDGQPVAGRLSGTFDLSRIPVAMVERVEVVKGAQSTLYGSEAMGGVVNIITRTPGTGAGAVDAVLAATAGAQGRRDGAARLALGRGAWSASGDVARRYAERAPGVARTDGALAARVDGAMKLRWSPDTMRAVEASVLALDERQRWYSGGFFGFSDNVQLNARVGASFARGAHRVSPGLSVSTYDHLSRSSTLSLPIAGDTGQRQWQRVHQAEVFYAGRLARAVALDAGAQLRVDEIETARVPGGLRSHTAFEPFAQLEIAPTRAVTLLPGVRMTQSSVWGTQLTPRMAARARLGERLTLRASVGDGFRAPDFKELFLFFQNTSAGYAVQGNPGLRPEHSRSTMLGAEYATGSGYLRAQLFHNAFRDFIETRVITAPEEAPVYEYANVDNGSTRGVEFEAGGDLLAGGRVRGELGYSYLATRDDATGRPLLGRPAHGARATLALPLLLAVRAHVTALHTGRTPMARDAGTGAITAWRDAFTRVDLRVMRGLPSAGLEFAFGVDNLFDDRPEEWAGFTGRHLYTSLTWTLSRPLAR